MTKTLQRPEPETEVPYADPVPPRPDDDDLDGTRALIPPTTGLSFGMVVSTALDYWELRKTRYGLAPLVFFTGTAFIGTLAGQILSFAGPNIIQDLHIDLVTLTGVSSVLGVVLIFASIILGYFLDRQRRVPWVGFGTIVSALASMAVSGAHNLNGLLGPRVIQDISGTAANTPQFSLLADYYPPEARGRVFALTATVTRVAALGSIFIGSLIVAAYGWRLVNFVLGIPFLILGVLVLIFLREPVRGFFERRAMGRSEEEAAKEDEPLSIEEAFRTTFAVRTLRRLYMADLVDNIGSATFSYFQPFLLADFYGLDIVQRAYIGLPSLIAALIGGYISGGLTDYFSRRAPSAILRLVGLFGLAGAMSTAVVAYGPPLWVLVIMGTVFAFVSGLTSPIQGALISQVVPPNIRTQALSVFATSALAGSFGLGLLGAGLFGAYGYSVVLYACVPFLVIGALIRVTSADFFDLDRREAFTQAVAKQEWQEARAADQGRLLIARDIDVFYGGVQVLFGVDFEVREGEIIALLGTNGAGKSTLLRAISGTQEASGGTIIFDGRDITHMPPHEVATRGVVHMPGGRGTFPELSVRDNLELGLWMDRAKGSTASKLARIYELFPILRERGSEPASALSGGEQQMLSLSQAFLSNPSLLMIDELSLGLSPAVVGQLLEIVREINATGTAIILVEQSVNVALTVARRCVFMEKGEVKFDGPTTDLIRRPDVLRAVYVKGTASMGGGEAVQSESAKARRRQQLDEAAVALRADGIVKRFGGVTALGGVSLELKQGEVLGIIGPNGSGKTTLFDVLSGYQRPDEGSVFLDGVDVTSLSASERAKRKLVRRFQDARLFPSLTVYENLLVALDQRIEVRNPALAALALPQAMRAERRARVRAERLLEILALDGYRDKFVKELSTGLRRIVDLAFVLATEPKVLLLDEPSSGIAQAETEGLAPLIRRVRYETGCAILIIEHDMSLISSVSDELIAMDRGSVVLRGTAETVLGDSRVIESYLGGSEAAIQRSGAIA